MTGYAIGEKSVKAGNLSCQIQSVNGRKGLDLQLNLPREADSLEADIRDITKKHISRGRVTISIRFHPQEASRDTPLRINERQLKAYKRQFDRLGKGLGTVEPVSLEYLLKLPGVVIEPEDVDGETLKPGILALLKKTLGEYNTTRAREGGELARDLKKRIQQLRKQSAAVQRLSKKTPAKHREALHRRLKEAKVDIELDPERLHRELALIADRLDISEEITRLDAHLTEFLRLIETPRPHGRHFDFLIQEIGREINTMGNKASDVEVSRITVDMKTELEKVREQVQNIE
jgi:uncharacterized protein (TIGR00255 family)